MRTKPNAFIDVDDEGRVGAERDISLRVVVADHCEMVIMEFLERTWPWSSERMKSMPEFDLRMIECGREVLLSLPPGVVVRSRRVGIRRVASETRYSPARALAAVVFACATNWTRPDVAGCIPYNFSTVSLYIVPLRRTKQKKMCPGLVPHGRTGTLKLEREDCMQAATERVQRETAPAAAVELCK